jgi:predicted PurR-regulated permease PerM
MRGDRVNGEERIRLWLRAFIGALAILAVLWAFYMARQIVVQVVYAVFLAYALHPVVDAVERVRVPFTRVRVGRSVASGVLVAGLVVLFVFALYRAVPAAAAQINKVLQDLPSYVSRAQQWAARMQAQYGESLPVTAWLNSVQAEAARISLQSGKYIGVGLFAAVNVVVRIIGFIVVPVATFYVLKDGKNLKKGLMGLIPHYARDKAEDVFRDVDAALSSYVRGLAAVCAFMAIASTVGFSLIGLNYPLILGAVVGICEIIPFAGFVIAALLVGLVGLFEAPWMAVKGLLVYVALNQLSSYVVTPRVMAARMKLHPLTVMVAVLVGAELAGVTGVILALPGVAVGKVLLMHLVVGRPASGSSRKGPTE